MECKVLGVERKMQNTSKYKKISFLYNTIYYLISNIYIYIINS